MFRIRRTNIWLLALFALCVALTACGGQTTPTPNSGVPTAGSGSNLIPPAEGTGEGSPRGNVGFAPISPECDRTLELNEAFEDEVIRLTNEERRKIGNPPYIKNDKLTLSARMHSKDMYCNLRSLSHTGSNGSEPEFRMTAAGYDWTNWAENAASGWGTPELVVESWMNSPGHRDNILSPNRTEIGVGYVSGPDGIYWTQNFGTPRGATPVPPAATNTPGGTEPTPLGCVATNDAAAEAEVINLINAARQARGLTTLATDPAFSAAARTHITDAACNRASTALDAYPFASGIRANGNSAAEQANEWITGPNADQFALGPDWRQVAVGHALRGGRNYWFLLVQIGQ